MRIAINTRFLLPHKMEGFGWYTYEIVRRLVINHPEHEFFFFFDRKYDEKFVFASNVTPIVLSPQARHPFLFYIWFEHSVRKALNKYAIDIFLSPDGYLTLKSNVKQIAVIHDINFEHNPKDLPWVMQKYLCKYFPKFAQKANHIITVSQYSKSDICKSYTISEDKVTVIWNGASDEFKPIDEKGILSAQNKFANGNPYFLFVGALHPRKNLPRLMLAFEQFKRSNPDDNHQLLIVGEEMFSSTKNLNSVPETIKTNVFFTGHLSIEELALAMAGASVFTFVPYFEGFGIPLVEAMKSGTPILSGDKTSLPEIAGDAALYCDPFDVEDITNKLSELALNEELKSNLKEKGFARSKLFSWETSASKVWKIIEAVNTN